MTACWYFCDAEKVLRDLKSLVCGLAIPCDRLGRIMLPTPSGGVHESDVELDARVALLGKRRQPSKRSGVIAPVGRSDGIVELRRCLRRSNDAENQDEEYESCVDHASTATARRRHDQDGDRMTGGRGVHLPSALDQVTCSTK
jgi:hypothetical protein